MAALLPVGVVQICDGNGVPYAAGTIDTFVPETTTPKTTWLDADKDAANTNPIVLDAAGRAVIYGDGLYRLVVKDADGNLIWDQPSSTLVSDAMAPVIIAPTIADAVILLGIASTIAAAVLVETNARIAAVAAEAATRAAADTALSNALAAEVFTRGINVSDLQTALGVEAAARIAGDAALQSQIDGGDIGPTLPPGAVVQTGSSTSNGSGDITVTFPFPYTGDILSFEVSSATLRLSVSSPAFDGPPVTLATGILLQNVGLQGPGTTALSTAFNWTAIGW